MVHYDHLIYTRYQSSKFYDRKSYFQPHHYLMLSQILQFLLYYPFLASCKLLFKLKLQIQLNTFMQLQNDNKSNKDLQLHKYSLEIILKKISFNKNLNGKIYISMNIGQQKVNTKHLVEINKNQCQFQDQNVKIQNLEWMFNKNSKKYEQKMSQIKIVLNTSSGDKKLLGIVKFDISQFVLDITKNTANTREINHMIKKDIQGTSSKLSGQIDFHLILKENTPEIKSIKKQLSSEVYPYKIENPPDMTTPTKNEQKTDAAKNNKKKGNNGKINSIKTSPLNLKYNEIKPQQDEIVQIINQQQHEDTQKTQQKDAKIKTNQKIKTQKHIKKQNTIQNLSLLIKQKIKIKPKNTQNQQQNQKEDKNRQIQFKQASTQAFDQKLKQIQKQNKKIFNKKIEQLQNNNKKQIKSLQQKLLLKELQLKNYKQQINNLLNNLATAKNVPQQQIIIKKQIKKLNKQLQLKNKQIQQLKIYQKSKVQKIMAENKNLIKQYQKKQKQQIKNKEENKLLIKQLQKKIQQIQKRYKQLIVHNEQLQNKIKKLNQENQKYKIQIQNLKKQIQQFNKAALTKSNIFGEASAQYLIQQQTLEQKIKKIQHEKNQIIIQYQKQKQKNKKIQKKYNEQLQKQKIKYDEAQQSYKIQLKKQQDKYTKLKIQLQSINEKIKLKQDENYNLDIQFKNVKIKLQKLNEKITTIKFNICQRLNQANCSHDQNVIEILTQLNSIV